MKRMFAITTLALASALPCAAGAQEWGNFDDDGCVKSQVRQFSAQLLNIPGDWEDACNSMPADVNGQHFDSPTRCVWSFGMWGEFEVADASCPNVYKVGCNVALSDIQRTWLPSALLTGLCVVAVRRRKR